MSWTEYFRRVPHQMQMWHWLGTPEDWKALGGWYYGEPSAIKQSNEHIGRRELQVYNRATKAWEIATVGDYVVQELLDSPDFRGGKGWHFRVIPEQQFIDEGWEPVPVKTYKPPGVYC
jgi:hypothetical protein